MKNNIFNSKNIILKLSLIALMAIILHSCQEKLRDFKPSSGIQRIVIDGFISDSTGANYVSITKTKDLLDKNPVPVVSNAMVILRDNLAVIDTFKFSTLTRSYLPSKPWKGVAGTNYTLTVLADGTTYTATDKMPDWPVFKIDSLKAEFRLKIEDKDTVRVRNNAFNSLFFGGKNYIKKGDSVFRIRMFAMKEQPYRVNVLTKVFRNKTPYFNPFSITVNNLQEVPINSFFINPPQGGGPPTTVNFISNDTITVVLAGITDNAFVYFSGINAVNGNDGGLFDSPAENPLSNFNNNALGYFRAVRITSKSLIVRKR